MRCQYCGASSDLTVDHIIPKSRGGTDSWDNLITACKNCNNKKGNKTPEEAHMTLMKKASRPNHLLLIKQYMGSLEENWRPYLFMD